MKLILDSNYICYVQKYALFHEMEYKGNRTEIIYGYLRQLLYLAQRFETTSFFFCWDSKESLRREIYEEYKSGRRKEKTEEERKADQIAYKQFDLLREEVLPSLGFRNIFIEKGFESDDLIAILVKSLKRPKIVVSSDEDMFQLLSYCSLYNISKKQLFTKKEFSRTYGLNPSDWIKIKSIAGCSSDNVIGVSGVGEKTAAKYLKGNLKKGKTLEKIENSKEIINNNRRLVALPFKEIELDIYEENNLREENFAEVFEQYGFESFLDNFSKWQKTFLLK